MDARILNRQGRIDRSRTEVRLKKKFDARYDARNDTIHDVRNDETLRERTAEEKT